MLTDNSKNSMGDEELNRKLVGMISKQYKRLDDRRKAVKNTIIPYLIT